MFIISFDWLILFLTMQNIITNVIVVDILGGCCGLYSFQKKKKLFSPLILLSVCYFLQNSWDKGVDKLLIS